jgi:CubicO group peptidase (beta-lactamase class C family)
MRIKLIAVVGMVASLPFWAAALPETKPEQVGISTERLHRVRETMQRHIAEHNIMGAVTLVTRKGRVVHHEAHGEMDKNAMFRIWSMSKPVAATAILMLMEDGKVRLNDPVSKFIPEFKGMQVALDTGRSERQVENGTPIYTAVKATREITVQDLLTHVSGLGSGPLSGSAVAKIPNALAGKLSDSIPKLGGTVLEFQPGSRWAYSALAAFDTLGRIVEVTSGQTFGAFLQKRLFDPLGMKETTFHPTAEQLARVAKTYHRDGAKMTALTEKNRMLNLYGKEYESGGGGLYSTASDYALFAQMLANGGQLNGQRLLSPKTVELMASAFVPDTMPGRQPGRAFGLSVIVINDPVAAGYRVGKGSYGWDGAFGTHFWIDPVEKIVGVMMIQVDNSTRQLDRDFESAVFQAIVE